MRKERLSSRTKLLFGSGGFGFLLLVVLFPKSTFSGVAVVLGLGAAHEEVCQ